MKTIYILSIMLLSLVGFAQTKPTGNIEITSSKVEQAAKLADILDIDLKSCKVLSYHFEVKSSKQVKALDVKEAGITDAIKTIVKSLKAGDKFVIENVLYDCPVVEHKKNFSFVVIR